MKIETGRPNTEGVGTERVEPQHVDRAARGGRQADIGADSVRLSSDAQLATDAARAAAAAPDIRQDKVDAARKALAAGRVGSDPTRLADRMIDSLLGN
jgi:flagellar biosynthesis anti-sigma factor FlgM